ncbi:MAG: anti-sigma factor [candidate division WOR-3 bacterium]
MKCSKVRKLLSRFLDNELSGPGQEAVIRHLAECAGCRQEYELLQSDHRLLQSATVPEISPYFTARTLARIRTLKPAPVLPKLVWQTAVSLLILAGIGLGILLGSTLAGGSGTGSELAALNAEPSIEELFTPGNGGR